MNIVIPTFEHHFNNNLHFLGSFQLYCKDKDKVSIFFICSQSNIDSFKSIISDFQDINIYVYTLHDLVKNVDSIDIDDSISTFNHKYSYQSLKKLLAYSVVKGDYLVIDSENLCLKDFFFSDVWAKLKKNEFSYTTHIYDELSIKVLKEVNMMLDTDYPYWFFNTSFWFFEYDHVKDLIKYFSDKGLIFNQFKDAWFFEYQLYCTFLVKMNKKQIYDVYSIANKNYNFEKDLIEIQWFWAYVCRALNNNNVMAYCKFLDETDEKITRLHWMPDNIKNTIIENSKICIGTFHF